MAINNVKTVNNGKGRNMGKEDSERLARIETHIENIFNRLDKINGSIEDYQITKERTNNNCSEINKIQDTIDKEIKPPLTKLTIKVYSTAILAGVFSGGIGSLIGFYIAKLFTSVLGG
ncbi:MAG: hypothetical protein M1308_23665 [Actinobacteria bacterium]|nr:hypothetical protein [Actinomycetota bacterium]